ncbi:hypothetical protein AOLI_G00187720 [Acnodon oligacanthus]
MKLVANGELSQEFDAMQETKDFGSASPPDSITNLECAAGTGGCLLYPTLLFFKMNSKKKGTRGRERGLILFG